MSEFSSAKISSCGAYRYELRRQWSTSLPVGFILLNPSTADDKADDPTIRRCIGFAKRWGAGGIVVGNLFAFRATDPRDLKTAADPIGPDNDAALRNIAALIGKNGRLVCGWGNHGAFMTRGRNVVVQLFEAGARPMAFAITKEGAPQHPLYLRADLEPFPL